jgi:hypothetical protein
VPTNQVVKQPTVTLTVTGAEVPQECSKATAVADHCNGYRSDTSESVKANSDESFDYDDS